MKTMFNNLKIEGNCLNMIKSIVPVIYLLLLSSKFTLQYLLCDGLDSLCLFPLQLRGSWPKEGAGVTLQEKDGCLPDCNAVFCFVLLLLHSWSEVWKCRYICRCSAAGVPEHVVQQFCSLNLAQKLLSHGPSNIWPHRHVAAQCGLSPKRLICCSSIINSSAPSKLLHHPQCCNHIIYNEGWSSVLGKDPHFQVCTSLNILLQPLGVLQYFLHTYNYLPVMV